MGKFKPVFLNELKNDLISLALVNKIPHLGVFLLSLRGFLVIEHTKHVQNKRT